MERLSPFLLLSFFHSILVKVNAEMVASVLISLDNSAFFAYFVFNVWDQDFRSDLNSWWK